MFRLLRKVHWYVIARRDDEAISSNKSSMLHSMRLLRCARNDGVYRVLLCNELLGHETRGGFLWLCSEQNFAMHVLNQQSVPFFCIA